MSRQLSVHCSAFLTAAAALLLVAGCRTPEASSATGAPPTLSSVDYAGSQAPLEDIDRQIASAGTDDAKLQPLAQQLLRVLRNPAAAPAARQAAAQRLAQFSPATLLAGDNRGAFLAMLQEPRDANLARLALDLAPGEAVDKVYLEALAHAPDSTRLAVVQSVGNRRIASATPQIAPLLKTPDFALEHAAIKALGQIGTAEALAALHGTAQPDSTAVVEAELQAAHQLPGNAARAVFEEIANRATAPAQLRAAAVRALLLADPAGAPARIVAVLSASDAAPKPVVIEAIPSLPATDLIPAITDRLPSWSPDVQRAVVTALGQTSDARAVAAISALVPAADAGVRAAAIEALGRLPGTPAATDLLAGVAAGDQVEDAKLARLSLARLNGAEVGATVVARAQTGDPVRRPIFVEQIAARGMTDQMPLLLALRQDPLLEVRLAALGALADIAPASTQAALLDWTLGATDAAEQARAVRALANVTLRNADETQRAHAIIDALDHASPTVATRLLPVLSRIGGQTAADCAARLALRPDRDEALVAANVLARWPDTKGLRPLVTVIEQTSTPDVRAASETAVVRYLERSRALLPGELVDLVRRLLAAGLQPEVAGQVVYLLGRAVDANALAYAQQLTTDAQVSAAAADAVLAIKAGQLGQPGLRGSAGEKYLVNILDGKPSTGWGTPATADQWIELDFHAARPVRQLVFEGGEFNYPEHLEVFVTDDPQNPGPALASVAGQPRKTSIKLPSIAHGRYLLIRHTQTREDSWWGISELLID